jgi:hypothetical protein
VKAAPDRFTREVLADDRPYLGAGAPVVFGGADTDPSYRSVGIRSVIGWYSSAFIDTS